MFIYSIHEPSFQSVVITIEGNSMATDGNTLLSIAIDDGANYIAGGALGEDQYYDTLEVTVEEDDGKILSVITCLYSFMINNQNYCLSLELIL